MLSTFPSIDSRLTFLSCVLGTLQSLRGGKVLLDRECRIIISAAVKCCKVIWDESRADYPQKETHSEQQVRSNLGFIVLALSLTALNFESGYQIGLRSAEITLILTAFSRFISDQSHSHQNQHTSLQKSRMCFYKAKREQQIVICMSATTSLFCKNRMSMRYKSSYHQGGVNKLFQEQVSLIT